MRRNAAANRERILAAAEEVFGARGAAGSTEEVARRAEVGIATVFRHFPTKAVLLEAALVRHFVRLTDQAAALTDRGDPGPAFAQLVRTLIETGSTKLVLVAQLPDDRFSAEVAEASDALRATVDDLLRSAQQAGAVRSSTTVDELYLIVRGLAQVTAAAAPPAVVLQGAIAIVLDGLRPS